MLQITTILFLLSLAMLAGAHYLALTFFLYWKVWWFDIVMHLWGGITVALGIFAMKDLFRLPERLIYFVPIISGILMVVLGWEIFEYYFGLVPSENYVSDTIIDICMGTLGGLLGFFLGHKMREL